MPEENPKSFACPYAAYVSGLSSIADHVCKVCGCAFGDHRHSESKGFPCRRCGASFGQKVHLQAHVKSVHERVRDKRCPHCPKMFTRNDYVSKHVKKWHSGGGDGSGDGSKKQHY